MSTNPQQVTTTLFTSYSSLNLKSMQQKACQLLSTAAVAAVSTTTSTVVAAGSTINYLGQSKILHILGPPWTRTFRCIWMLEEINEEYYQRYYENTATTTTMTSDDQTCHTSSISSVPQQVPYYLLYNAKPLSTYVKKYQPTGKVPVLVEYDIKHQPHDDDDNHMSAVPRGSVLNDSNIFVLSEASAINTYLYDQYGLYSCINNQNSREEEDATKPSTTRSTKIDHHHPLVPPVGSQLRGQYDAVLSCICTELDAQGLWMHRKHDVMSQQLTGAGPNHDAVQHAKNHFKRINSYLAHLCNPYLLGAHFTAADILYVHCLQWSQSIGWSDDTWPAADASAPVKVDAIKEQQPNDATGDEDPSIVRTAPPPSLLQPYLDLCLSRPAYQRAVQIRDGRGEGVRTPKSKL